MMTQNWFEYVAENNLLVKIVNVSELGLETRLESEFYNKSKGKYKLTGSDVIKEAQYGTSKYLNEENHGYPVLRLNEFNTWFISKPSKYCDLISEDTYEDLRLRKDDVLVCRTNGNPKYVGKSAIVMEDTNFAYASYLFKIKTNSQISPSALVSFLNSKYGREEIERYSIVSNQANFSPAKFKLISIPSFPENLQRLIDDIVFRAHMSSKESTEAVIQLEKLLLFHLDFADFTPSTVNYSSRSSNEAKEADRLDGEYWMPKYDEILARLTNNAGSIGDFFDVIKGSNVTYLQDGTRRVIKTKQLKNLFIDIESIEDSTSEGTLIEDGSMLFASMGVGSLGKADMFYQNLYPGEYVTDSTIFTVKPKKDFYAEYLLCLIRNSIYQQLIYRYIVGSSGIISISKDSFLSLPVPKLNGDVQKEMKNGVIDSHNLLSKSKHLLEVAKRAVELFIEQDEDAAQEYIKQNYEQV